MNINEFRAIMRDIDEKADGDVTCWFLVQTGKVVGLWEWLNDADDSPPNTGNEVIIVSSIDQPPCYIPVASIFAVQVAPK